MKCGDYMDSGFRRSLLVLFIWVIASVAFLGTLTKQVINTII